MEGEEESVGLQEKLCDLIPLFKERLSRVKRELGDTQVGGCAVKDIVGGARGIKCILWDVSKLDPDHGILYRGFSIPECLALLPPSPDSLEEATSPSPSPLPEGLLWLLLTSQMPSRAQCRAVSLHLRDLAQKLPPLALDCISVLPSSSHPMTQLISGIMALQTSSVFSQAYSSGMPVPDLWRPALHDCLSLITQLPLIAAFIYRRAYRDGQTIPADPRLDLAANFCHMLGFDNPRMYEMMRMYMIIHSDHEGGAVSSHAVRLVGSALADPYHAFAAGMSGCAGPLHGLAIQESFRWLKKVLADVGQCPSSEKLEGYVQKTLESGKVIPGFGHALLKTTDPRYTCLYKFCESNLAGDPLFQLLAKVGEAVPKVMKQQGKVRNPQPNVDAIIGVVFNHFGLGEEQFFPVVLGVARSIGALSQLVLDRALCLPIERPSSVTLDWIEDYCKKQSNI